MDKSKLFKTLAISAILGTIIGYTSGKVYNEAFACKVPSRGMAAAIQLKCLAALDNAVLRHRACSQLSQGDDCDLHGDTRRELVISIIDEEADKCYQLETKAAGYCSSK